MLKGVLSIFRDSQDKLLKKHSSLVNRVNGLEPELEKLGDEELEAKTDELKERLQGRETLDDLLAEAFALVREASKRTIGLRHFDVQLIGGLVLHQGKIAEMKTGEGKTLAATLPVYLNALEGKGVHVVTVNDYLAKRDTVWMGPIYRLLGLTVGCLQHEASYVYDPSMESENSTLHHMRPVPRKEAYAADITYGTNHEFGFDYLRDNMVLGLNDVVQRDLCYAIVDEVDYILIDEARTPLIISGPTQESTQIYPTMARLAQRLQEGVDFTIDEKHRNSMLTEEGVSKVEKWLNIDNLYDPRNYLLTHYVENALRAQVVYKLDRDYVVKDNEVIIVDEFTGRLMNGRRYSDGLHQAIEAKEGVKVQQETATYATITLQNYFRMYKKLAGMTGTAATEVDELLKIYRLDVEVIPTHMQMVREDMPDLIYKTDQGKWSAIVDDIEQSHNKGQPLLIGTTSIEKSEALSEMLSRRGVPHQVLNAKLHEKEAAIVSQAGRVGAVTVATNMAGRGTDIILGGNPSGRSSEDWQREHQKVVDLGGLYVLGTEKHEARRVDNQLRGRSGRQGDPGISRFYVSLEDDLMRRFGGDRIKTIMNWAGIRDDQPLENRMVSKAIEGSQEKVEGYHFEIRKHLVEYDDVVNRHRDVIYAERRKILSGADLKANVLSLVETEIKKVVATHISAPDPKDWDIEGLSGELQTIFPPSSNVPKDELANLSREEVEARLLQLAGELYEEKERTLGIEAMRTLERLIMLRTIDTHWIEHLTAMSNLREGIGLQAIGQRDPLVAFKTEGHERFQNLLSRIRHVIARTIYHVTITVGNSGQPAPAVPQSPMAKVVGGRRSEAVAAGGSKVGRNDPCPCGSGKKYKRCHGLAA